MKPIRKQLNNFAQHPLVFLLIRIVVGGVFLLFGVIKIIEDHEIFYQSIRDYQMLPEAFIPVFGTVLPWIEVVLALFFLVGLFARLSAFGLLGLLLMFMIAITQAVLRGLELSDCGCSGSRIRLGESPEEVLLRDGILLIGVLWFLWKKRAAQRWTADQFFEQKSQ